MSATYNIRRDLNEALAMAQGLDAYVRSRQLYGFTAGNIFSGMPSLTAGALLLRLRRLDVLREQMRDSDSKKLDKAVDLYTYVRNEWAFHYEGKVLREAHSRIDAMKGFFYECAENIRQCGGIYKPEMTRRTIVQELLRELAALKAMDDDLDEKVKGTDEQLQKYLEPATFQWSQMLKPAYPADEFWWLFHAPPNLP